VVHALFRSIGYFPAVRLARVCPILPALNPEISVSRLLIAFPLKDPHQRDALTDALAQLGLPV
jgi:hypothetical protein